MVVKVVMMEGRVKMEHWLQISEIAEQLEIPENTLRRYAKLFSDFLPSEVFGRITKYSPECVGIFERISFLYKKGKPTEEIYTILTTEVPIRAYTVEERSDINPPAITPAMVLTALQEMQIANKILSEQIDNIMNALKEQHEELKLSQKTIELQQEIIDELRKEIEELKNEDKITERDREIIELMREKLNKKSLWQKIFSPKIKKLG